MITLLIGENSFEIKRALREFQAGFDGDIERIDSSDVELRQLPDLLMGATLFSTNRLIIMYELSVNTTIWPLLPDWLGKISDDVHLVLVEPKPDKRTTAYKQLKKLANVREFPAWSERDRAKAEAWVAGEARLHDITIDKAGIRKLVDRVGVNQWGLYHALQKLSVLDEITLPVIEEVIDPTPAESVFNLLESSLRGDAKRVSQMIETLQLTEDPYRTFGLLSGQVFQLAVLANTSKPSSEVAKDIGAHPFALSKLAPHARKLGPAGAKAIVVVAAEADTGMKLSKGEPWLLIERALLKIAQIKHRL
jgi:DNA polymerase III subunit delta